MPMSAAVTWLQNSIGVDVTGEWARHIHLNVGGTFYTTRRHTLRSLKDHPVFGPVLEGRAHRCEDGSFLIDRDGAMFRYVLHYLRDGRLTVPDGFSEWDMLLQEVRYYALAELEKAILDRFDYQRSVFRRELPHGVYVSWSTTPISPSPGAVMATAASPPPGTSTPATPPAKASTSQPASPAATPAVVVSQPVPVGLDPCASIHIVPPLPGLRVEPAKAASSPRAVVMFREAQVLQDLDQLVTVLLSAYGYAIQHWDEDRGRVLLMLPGQM